MIESISTVVISDLLEVVVLIDLHSHSILSDGVLPIDEMVMAAARRGYAAYAVTDHVHPGADHVAMAREVRRQIDALRSHVDMELFAGVELTEYDPAEIHRVALEVRGHGAQIVVVHGECVSAHVPAGTNAAAVRSEAVTVLAHPGLLEEHDAEIAARTGVAIELSARVPHCYTNGHVYRVARKAGARIVVDSDGHDGSDLLSVRKQWAIARGAGASELSFLAMVEEMAPRLVQSSKAEVAGRI